VHVSFVSGIEAPYTVLEVGLDDQDDLVLESMLVGGGPHDLRIGQRMAVRFVEEDGVTLHGFAPLDAASAALRDRDREV
jgi:hypothetical protein